MKNVILINVIFIFMSTDLIAQVSIPANNGTLGDYVGWDGFMAGIPLEIRHNSTAYDPIDFYVNGLKQMQLLPIATSGADAARLGISPEWTTFVPAEQLHQNLERHKQLWHLFTNR